MLEGQEVQRGEAGNLEYDVAIPVAAADLAILYEAMVRRIVLGQAHCRLTDRNAFFITVDVPGS